MENIKIEKLTFLCNHILPIQFFTTVIDTFYIFKIESNCCVTYQRNGNNFVTGQISSFSFIRISLTLKNNQFAIYDIPRNQYVTWYSEYKNINISCSKIQWSQVNFLLLDLKNTEHSFTRPHGCNRYRELRA